ncbi:MAG: hypothetical protein NT141_01225 [candidate division WWE3 bacterium]|nr:hypothetical protein [candidate division WWE3 bacterium]
MVNLKPFIIALLFLGIGLLFRTAVFADDTATVTATVHTELISVSTSVSSLDYGLIRFGMANDLPNPLSMSNTGNVAENFQIIGSNAVERNDHSKVWVLNSNSGGINVYREAFFNDGVGATPHYFSADSYMSIANNVSPSGNVSLYAMKLEAPSAGSYSGIFDTAIYFRATKAV